MQQTFAIKSLFSDLSRTHRIQFSNLDKNSILAKGFFDKYKFSANSGQIVTSLM